MTELWWLSATEIAAAYKAKTLSPVELMTSLFERVARLDPVLHAFILPDPEAAMAAARQAEAEMAAGRSRGPLHGIPVGIKDIIDVAGLPTTCHSKILLGQVAAADSHVVAQLRGAGAIIMGKLSTHEFAIGGPIFDLPFPPARNPWNPKHHPGGSSSGSGAGLAGGLFPLALGTDTGGSVRNPASACGIVGLKPTYGLVSRRGVFPLSFTMDHVGPMARTAADAATLLDVIAGYDPADPGSAATAASGFTSQIDRGVKGLRIGFVRHFHTTDMVASPDVAAALEQVAADLTRQGAAIRDVTLPPLDVFRALNRVILHAESWAIHAKWLQTRPGDYGKATRHRLMTGAFLSAGDYVQAQRRRLEVIAAVNEVFREVDVLMLASAMDTPAEIENWPEVERTYSRQARAPFNVTGHPAVAMMSGLSPAGLPTSVQFVGPAFADGLVLRVAAAYEREATWHGKRPALAA
ncbi:amidase [Acidisphaera sp. L21]|uniref:amidase n=1 Tax=Acidisphaera sp. L21 TaxID=1641851 RepID=UPI00131D6C9A|nr:amidase [Acidisphaera sp. L21]